MASPDTAARLPGAPDEIAEVAFSDVINDVTKHPQAIEIKQDSVSLLAAEQSLERTPDDQSGKTLGAAPAALPPAVVESTPAQSPVMDSAAEAETPAAQPDGTLADGPKVNTAPAENSHPDGNSLPVQELPSGTTSTVSQPSSASTVSQSSAASTVSQPSAASTVSQPSSASAADSVLSSQKAQSIAAPVMPETAGSPKNSEAAAGNPQPSTEGDTEAVAAQPERRLSTARENSSATLPAGATAAAAPALQANSATLQSASTGQVALPAASSEPAAVIVPPVESATTTPTPGQRRESAAELRGVQHPVRQQDSLRTVSAAVAIPRNAAATAPLADIVSTQSPAVNTAVTVSTLPGDSDQVRDNLLPSSLASRLQQLNAASARSADAAPTLSSSAAQKIEISGPLSIEVPTTTVIQGAASIRSDSASALERSLSRERSARIDARVTEATLSSAGTNTTAEASRSEVGMLRGDQSAALNALPAQLARQVLHSHARNLSELRLQLKPEELGSLDLKLRVDGDRVHVAMITSQPGVRELMEAQLPQLRQMLEQGGLQLGDVDVTQRDSDSSGDQPRETSLLADDGPPVTIHDGQTDTELPPRSPDGLIDAFV